MGKHIVVTAEHVKTHVCENCQANYAYRMRRKAECPVNDILGFSSEKAKKKAEDEATERLTEKFRTEADAVACPKCGWYQHEMIAGRKKLWFFVGVTPVFLTGVGVLVAPAFMHYGVEGKPTTAWVVSGIAIMALSLVVGAIFSKVSYLNAGHPGGGIELPDRAARSRGQLI